MPRLISFDHVKTKPVEWLWEPYIPLDGVTVVYGPGGVGKSSITIDLAARISRGDPFPGQSVVTPRAKVLMLSAEDDYERILRPRLDASRADVRQIVAPETLFTLDKAGMGFVRHYVEEIRPSLVTIDPIVYFSGPKVDINRSNEVRHIMKDLFTLAGDYHLAVVVVGHVRKSTEGSDADRMMGSADWINASRSGILVTHGNEGQPIMRHTKHNWGPGGSTWTFTMDGGHFEWTGQTDDIGMILPTDGLSYKGGKKAQATRTWVLTYLKGGQVPLDEFIASGIDEGFSRATIYRVQEGLWQAKFNKTDHLSYASLVGELIKKIEG